jgi:hypothetical protein
MPFVGESVGHGADVSGQCGWRVDEQKGLLWCGAGTVGAVVFN